jgi:hypothetical protein
MENQHTLIKGYRDLSQEEINQMNIIKNLGNEIGVVVSALETIPGLDKRWIEIGKTDLQTGIMALVRAIAKPQSF